MKTRWGRMRRLLLGLSPEATRYDRRGFRGATEPMRARLEQAGATFLAGYHAALEQDSSRDLERELNSMPAELGGFAFEGAAMGLALLEALTPWRGSRIAGFLQGPGDAHAYMAHVGVGWVWARLPFGSARLRLRLDPLLQWLAFDGWGFHEGFFQWQKYFGGKPPPTQLVGYEKRAFNQGLGRSWWFVNGGNPALIGETISPFPAQTQADMWSGVGLAATYAGILAAEELADLRKRAGAHWPQLAQGAAFAAKARERAGNITDYTDLAAHGLSGISARQAARLCDATLENCAADHLEPAYEVWRRRIQHHFANKLQLKETCL